MTPSPTVVFIRDTTFLRLDNYKTTFRITIYNFIETIIVSNDSSEPAAMILFLFSWYFVVPYRTLFSLDDDENDEIQFLAHR